MALHKKGGTDPLPEGRASFSNHGLGSVPLFVQTRPGSIGPVHPASTLSLPSAYLSGFGFFHSDVTLWFGRLWATFPPLFAFPCRALLDGPVSLVPIPSSLRQLGERRRMHGYRWFNPKVTRRIALVLAVTLAIESASCGTVLHPERCGRAHSGALDPSIVVLDGLGVLVFLVPGVVAFIVDFSTGAIWLPDQHFSPYVPVPIPPPGAYPPPMVYPPGMIGPPPGASAPPQPLTSLEPPAVFRASSRPLTRIDTHGEKLTRERIEAIIRAHTGQTIKLDAPDVRAIRANNIEDASATLRNAQSAPNVESPAPPK